MPKVWSRIRNPESNKERLVIMIVSCKAIIRRVPGSLGYLKYSKVKSTTTWMTLLLQGGPKGYPYLRSFYREGNRLKEIFVQEGHPIYLFPYEVFVTSSNSGLLEFVPDT